MTPQQRETMEIEILFVGAGPANLSAAYQLKKSVEAFNEKAKRDGGKQIPDPMILVVDKAAKIGGHTLSGAVVDPIAFRELFPDVVPSDFPFLSPVTSERVMNLTSGFAAPIPGPLLPKEMHNGGLYVASLCQVTRWLAKKCEEAGVEVYPEFVANEFIRDGGRIVGAKIADKRVDEDGKPVEGYTPGMDVFAKVTVVGEGTRGFLAQELIQEFKLDAQSNPQIWGLGIKELIEIPAGSIQKGAVIHTMGYPLNLMTYGGSFIYGMSDTLISIGLVLGLDYGNPWFEPHDAFLRLKKHPMVSKLITGGKIVEYGAKTLPEGGYYALPRFAADGALLTGDSAGLLNCMRLKGVHLAMKSGMLAAERICQALAKDDFSAAALDYRQDLETSWAGEELRRARNFRQSFHGGMIPGMIATGLHMLTGGKKPGGRRTTPPDYQAMRKIASPAAPESSRVKTDRDLYLDIETDVFLSGSVHREDQAPHCHLLDPQTCFKCFKEYAAPCTRFCPAKVYEAKHNAAGEFDGIHVSFSNCVHCKTCEIKDPLQNLKWFPPDGGDGPKYQNM